MACKKYTHVSNTHKLQIVQKSSHRAKNLHIRIFRETEKGNARILPTHIEAPWETTYAQSRHVQII